LHARGHSVVIAGVYDFITGSMTCTEENGIIVYRFPRYKRFHGFFRSRLRLCWEVRKIIKKHSIDLVEVPDFMGMLAYWPRLPVPVVARLHGSVTYFLNEMNQSLSPHYYKCELSTLKKADEIVSVSNYTAESTKRIFQIASPVSVIYNSVGFEQSDFPTDTKRESNVAVYTGTLSRKKGVISLIDAWPEVLEKIPHANLRLFGKDFFDENGISMMSILKKRIPAHARDSIVFFGHVDRDRVIDELKSASVAVFPSFSEAFALAPLEAMALGCPTIYTKLASGPEIIDEGVNGVMVDPSKPGEIAEAIIKVLTDARLAAAIGARGRSAIRNKFSNEIILLKNETMYKTLLARSGKNLFLNKQEKFFEKKREMDELALLEDEG
jgi:glycosyltransferase involved in cell wall biosynthesis